MRVPDPTTAAIAEQVAEREQLRAEVARLVDENATLRRFLDAEKAQCDGMGRRNLEVMAILGGSYPDGVVERARAVVMENARLSKALAEAYTDNEVTIADRDRLRALVEKACGELDDTGGEFAAQRAVEILREAGINDPVNP